MSNDSVPTKQKAWQVVRRGNPSRAVVFNDEVPVPSKLSKGEVLVEVHAGALNPVGHKIMRLFPNALVRCPHTAEYDISGVIVNPNGSDFQKGDQIFGWIPMPMTLKTGQGALSQYTRLPADHITHKPAAVSFTQAAGIGLAGTTAYQGLERAKIEAGQTILVNGGTTAVGSFAIQIAKAKGCTVVATCSTANIEVVKGLGADEVIDYKATPVPQHLQKNPPTPKFHVIFDTVGSSADLFTSSPAYLAPNGIFVSVGITNNVRDAIVGFCKTMLWPVWLGGTNRKHIVFGVDNKKEDLEALRSLIEEGQIKPLIDSVYAFEDVHNAYERIMTGRARGKVVVTVIP